MDEITEIEIAGSRELLELIENCEPIEGLERSERRKLPGSSALNAPINMEMAHSAFHTASMAVDVMVILIHGPEGAARLLRWLKDKMERQNQKRKPMEKPVLEELTIVNSRSGRPVGRIRLDTEEETALKLILKGSE